jgi:flagellar biosynthetic protein FliQ
MNETDVAALIQECMVVTLKMGGPPLIAGLLVGLVVSFVQAITQINEATLAFLPKVVAIGATMVLLGPFMAATLITFTHHVLDRLISIGGS